MGERKENVCFFRQALQKAKNNDSRTNSQKCPFDEGMKALFEVKY